MLETVEPDVHLVADLLALSGVMPAKTKETARLVVRKCVEELERKLARTDASGGASARSTARSATAARATAEIDWNRTIRANLRHYQPEYKTIVPETPHRIRPQAQRPARHHPLHRPIRVDGDQRRLQRHLRRRAGFAAGRPHAGCRLRHRRRRSLRETLRPGRFSLRHPIGRRHRHSSRLSYCQSLVRQPDHTIMVLISDLIEGGVREKLSSGRRRSFQLRRQPDHPAGAERRRRPAYDHANAAALAALGSPAFACTPDSLSRADGRRDIPGRYRRVGIIAGNRSGGWRRINSLWKLTPQASAHAFTMYSLFISASRASICSRELLTRISRSIGVANRTPFWQGRAKDSTLSRAETAAAGGVRHGSERSTDIIADAGIHLSAVQKAVQRVQVSLRRAAHRLPSRKL